MEKYSDFLKRISYQKPELQLDDGDFKPDGRVYEKVSEDNRFKPFYGDTTVFDLDSRTKEKIYEQIRKLYSSSPECFSEQIKPDTIHMTLHDLSASDDLSAVSSDTFNNEVDLICVLNKSPIEHQQIKMRTNYVINMVNTSLVLSLVPKDEIEWDKLQEMYDIISKVRECPYPYLTPHITLAYFNHHGFSAKSAAKLKETVCELNKKYFDVTLNTNRLYYQKFVSMNDYRSVFKLGKNRRTKR